ncbi:hypothetical protein AZE42_04137 [Rhizopogon vesiculosus]|uniref:N-acetyltransferase domain-containing protein n=1 Tax=Rhizopogon vesiculosus TaxID=180088 RepID=A0A1J8QBI4_9AGAM|nr:hypothetical protein AZE42_04137 [Rhizopogon vesiculosus]
MCAVQPLPLPFAQFVPHHERYDSPTICHLTPGNEITDDLLKSCASLFNTNYGIWGSTAGTLSQFTKPGEPVRLTSSRLRAQCVSSPEKTLLVTCFRTTPTLGNQLIGHAFASDPADHNSVGWVTQLVVDKSVRKRYIATQLLQTLKFHSLFASVKAVGLVSSHPAACNALAKYASANFYEIDLTFIRDHAEGILASSSISYLKAAQLKGSVFQADCDNGALSSVFTSFYVDHAGPLEALEQYKAKGQWGLGDLLDGHEFLVIFPVVPMSPIANTL